MRLILLSLLLLPVACGDKAEPDTGAETSVDGGTSDADGSDADEVDTADDADGDADGDGDDGGGKADRPVAEVFGRVGPRVDFVVVLMIFFSFSDFYKDM